MLLKYYHVSSEHTKLNVRDFYQFQWDECECDPIQVKDPSAVFLAEIWVGEARLKVVQRNLNFEIFFLLNEIIEVEDWHCIGVTQ